MTVAVTTCNREVQRSISTVSVMEKPYLGGSDAANDSSTRTLSCPSKRRIISSVEPMFVTEYVSRIFARQEPRLSSRDIFLQSFRPLTLLHLTLNLTAHVGDFLHLAESSPVTPGAIVGILLGFDSRNLRESVGPSFVPRMTSFEFESTVNTFSCLWYLCPVITTDSVLFKLPPWWNLVWCSLLYLVILTLSPCVASADGHAKTKNIRTDHMNVCHGPLLCFRRSPCLPNMTTRQSNR